jgi:cyclopropane fatty-acyl-phospholipid synthase-like methyltransferase
MVGRILSVTGAGPSSSVLSVGCGIGDTEILLARHVGRLTGVDLSPSAVRQAREDAARAGARNAVFEEGTIESVSGQFDLIIAIFVLHHLPDETLDELPAMLRARLAPKGVFYSLDPSRLRLSGYIGGLLFPKLMARYQSPDERELGPQQTLDRFNCAGLSAKLLRYDFVSTPLAGLFPGWRSGYRIARVADEILVRTPGLNALSSNFEIVARPTSE